jgi:hypothetical protein
MTKYKIIIGFLFIITSYLAADIITAKKHEQAYGPYQYKSAELVYFYASCVQHLNSRTVLYRTEVILEGTVIETSKPFIGLYPLDRCLLGRYSPIYDIEELVSFSEGDIITIIVDSENRIYLGKAETVFSYIIFGISCALCLLALLIYKRLKLNIKVIEPPKTA